LQLYRLFFYNFCFNKGKNMVDPASANRITIRHQPGELSVYQVREDDISPSQASTVVSPASSPSDRQSRVSIPDAEYFPPEGRRSRCNDFCTQLFANLKYMVVGCKASCAPKVVRLKYKIFGPPDISQLQQREGPPDQSVNEKPPAEIEAKRVSVVPGVDERPVDNDMLQDQPGIEMQIRNGAVEGENPGLYVDGMYVNDQMVAEQLQAQEQIERRKEKERAEGEKPTVLHEIDGMLVDDKTLQQQLAAERQIEAQVQASKNYQFQARMDLAQKLQNGQISTEYQGQLAAIRQFREKELVRQGIWGPAGDQERLKIAQRNEEKERQQEEEMKERVNPMAQALEAHLALNGISFESALAAETLLLQGQIEKQSRPLVSPGGPAASVKPREEFKRPDLP
jgi:hypothetical protein